MKAECVLLRPHECFLFFLTLNLRLSIWCAVLAGLCGDVCCVHTLRWRRHSHSQKEISGETSLCLTVDKSIQYYLILKTVSTPGQQFSCCVLSQIHTCPAARACLLTFPASQLNALYSPSQKTIKTSLCSQDLCHCLLHLGRVCWREYV